MSKKNILGIIITFNPPVEFLSNLDILCKQVDKVLVVDNTSNADSTHFLTKELNNKKRGVEVIFNESNLGIATALNQGFSWGVINGYEYAVVLDQDSLAHPNMVKELLSVYKSQSLHSKVAMVAPNIKSLINRMQARYLIQRKKILFERVSCKGNIIDNASLVITSGSLNNLLAYREIGEFREDFFIDYVDTEYCLRAKKLGYKIVVACHAILYHQLGNQQEKRLGFFRFYPTFHSPVRWYYINRNRVIMHNLYAIRYPFWALYDLIACCYIILKMFLFEDTKSKKILAFFLGMVDGIFGRMGHITSYREIQILGRK